MTLWAVLPVKPLTKGKSRLADWLDDQQRLALNRCFLDNTLEVLRTVPGIERVLVVSRDPQVLATARRYGALTLMEPGNSNLNLALNRAAMVLQRFRVRKALIVPADLPMLDRGELEVMISKSDPSPVMVIAPDRHLKGTNVLLVSPVDLVPYSFGPGSFERHCYLARQAGGRLEVCELPSLALDVDLPEDLELVGAELERLEI